MMKNTIWAKTSFGKMLVKHDIQDWLEITPWFVEYMYMISEDTVLLTSRYHFANQRIPKQSLSYMHWNVRMHKDKNFSFVSTEFLIGLNSHQILWNLQAACILILRFVNNFLITKSHLSLLIKVTETLQFIIVNFSWVLFATLMIGRNLTQKGTL